MDGKFQTSFIPKKPVMLSVKSRSHSMSLFMTISIFIFVVSLVLAGLVFAGQRYLQSQLEKDKESFYAKREAFDSFTVEALVKLDNRIESAKKILNKHIAILPVFDFLESNTLKNIRFKTVNISLLENGSAILDFEGEAKNFSAIALQSDVFAESKELKNPIISDIDLTLVGGVTFNFKSEVDSNFILYKNTREDVKDVKDNIIKNNPGDIDMDNMNNEDNLEIN